MNKFITLRRSTFYVLAFCTFVAVILCGNAVRQVLAKEDSPIDPYDSLKTLTDVLALVQKNYVEPVDTKKIIEGAVKGMVSTLDPHSSYLPPDSYRDLQIETKGEFGGLGIEITAKDGLLTVVAPVEDSPAARAGIQPGDQIIKIGNDFTKNLSLVDAVKMMRGPKGSSIVLSIHRGNREDLIPVTIVRDVIRVKSVRFRMLDEGFGYVRLAQFQDNSAKEFGEALNALKAKHRSKELNGLVIDLRNDPGGLLTEAIRVADLFLKEGIVVYTDGRLESQKQKYFAHDDGNEPTYPLVVLVNGGSASASEIVAGALQDDGRALILGTQSFGKGSVQTILPMENGDALRLTTALYFTKSGRSIQAQGVTPDVTVLPKKHAKAAAAEEKEDERGMQMPKERDLPGALRNPKLSAEPEKQQEKQEKPADNSADGDSDMPIGSRIALEADLPKLLNEDAQLAEALRLLKTWHVFKGKPTIQAESPKTDGAA